MSCPEMPVLMWASLVDYLPLQDMRNLLTVCKRVTAEVTSEYAKTCWRRRRVYDVRVWICILKNTQVTIQQSIGTSDVSFAGGVLERSRGAAYHHVFEHSCKASYGSFLRLTFAFTSASYNTPSSAMRVTLVRFDVDNMDVLHVERQIIAGRDGDAIVLGPIGIKPAHLPSPLPPPLFPTAVVYTPDLVRFVHAE